MELYDAISDSCVSAPAQSGERSVTASLVPIFEFSAWNAFFYNDQTFTTYKMNPNDRTSQVMIGYSIFSIVQ